MARNKQKPAPAPTTEPYTPTPKESAIASAILARRREAPPPIKFTVSKAGGKTIVEQDHPSQAVSTAVLMHSLGSINGHFTECLLSQLANVVTIGTTLHPADLNHAVAMVQGIRPADETEAMLAAQMVAIHNATMTAARRLKNVDMITQQDSASNMLNKLARTFAIQVEALKKYRSAGEQTIKVQHVTVNEGGQAIVGNVRTGGGGTSETGGQPHEPCRDDERSPALLGHLETLARAMPSPGGEGLDRVPLSRRTRRGTQGQD